MKLWPIYQRLSAGLFRWTVLVVVLNSCSLARQDSAYLLKASKQTMDQAVKHSKRFKGGRPKPIVNQYVLQDLTQKENNVDDLYSQAKIDVSVNNMPIKEFLNSLMIGTKESIVISPGLEGMVNLNLKQVTVTDVLNILTKLYNMTYDRTRYGYVVALKKLETKIFTLNLLDIVRRSNNSTSVNNIGLSSSMGSGGGQGGRGGQGGQGGRGGQGGGSNNQNVNETSNLVTQTTNEFFWASLKNTIEQLTSRDEGSSVAINRHTGVVTVTAMPDTLVKVSEFIRETEEIANREVHIEAKIIELELSHEFKTGVDWELLNINYQSGVGIFNKAGDSPGFKDVLQLLSKEGKVMVLSNPRVSTLNNQQAIIKVGGDRYFLTNVTTSNTPVGNSTQQQFGIDLQPFFSGLSLQVLPQIQANNEIKLFIHPVISTVTDDTRDIRVSQQQVLSLPLAKSVIRETDSVVKAKNKQIIILGGLMQGRGMETNASLPVLDQVNAYPNNDHSTRVIELIILIKAWVATDKNWTNTLEALAHRYKSLSHRVERRL